MGDCRIRILIANDLIPSAKEDVLISRIYSSDTTIREVVQDNKFLFDLFSSNLSFNLWDTTLNPSKNITDWPIKDFPELQGPKSKTLHSAGCFPSASWLALPKEVDPKKFRIAEYDDFQYNQQQHLVTNHGTPSIQFKDKELASSSSKPLPSQVMQSVTNRFKNDQEMNKDGTKSTTAMRRENLELRHKTEQERAAKLDQRIKKLEEQSSGKNKRVTDQVKTMIVKSRATGVKSIKMQDRLYFECMVEESDDLTKEYRYFSPQDTFAKIASSFSRPSQSELKNSEVLVKKPDDITENNAVYQRFPVATRVYEAIADGYLTGELNTIIIRWYRDNEEPTPSIEKTTEEVDDVEMLEFTIDPKESGGDDQKMAVEPLDTASTENGCIEDMNLADAIKAMDDKLNQGRKAKKKSAAAVKVRNMQIKSKAKGDAKRVSKIDDRFYMDVIMVSSENVAQSSFHFLSKKDPIERILQVLSTSTTKAAVWEFLVPVPTEDKPSKFTIIPNSMIPLIEAEEQNILKSFGRIIIRPRL